MSNSNSEPISDPPNMQGLHLKKTQSPLLIGNIKRKIKKMKVKKEAPWMNYLHLKKKKKKRMDKNIKNLETNSRVESLTLSHHHGIVIFTRHGSFFKNQIFHFIILS